MEILNKIKSIIWGLYIKSETGVYFHPTMHRFFILKKSMKFLIQEDVKGDYFEFGIARGLNFVNAYKLAKKNNLFMKKFYAFDSFEGFPKLHSKVDRIFQRCKQGEENWAIEHFNKNIKKCNVNPKNLEIKKGWFKETLTKEYQKSLIKKNVKAALIWVDCDLYDSTRDALKFIKPFLQTGTVIAFDDWFLYRGDINKGEQRATNEFLKKNPKIHFSHYSYFGITGNTFIVTLKETKELTRD